MTIVSITMETIMIRIGIVSGGIEETRDSDLAVKNISG
jgi:hypothetical protein